MPALETFLPSVGDDYSVTLIDITQRKRHEHMMLADALNDPLTGVHNRRGVEQKARACIHPTARPTSRLRSPPDGMLFP